MRINLSSVPVESGTNYPEAFRTFVAGRSRQRVGNAAGITNFGVNLTTLQPGSQSALRHWHKRQDEFIYVISGELVLATNDGEQTLHPGDMAGFAAGVENGHHLVNRSQAPATYLEIGDRTAADSVDYPDHDLKCILTNEGTHQYMHKDGSLH
ncbi:MAG: cupin domain-containing protein [Cyanobacteria bacterium J06649_4]